MSEPAVSFGEPAPAEPICRSAEDARQPCRFAHLCPESRQRRHHYDAQPPLRGMGCYVYQHLVELEAREAHVKPDAGPVA